VHDAFISIDEMIKMQYIDKASIFLPRYIRYYLTGTFNSPIYVQRPTLPKVTYVSTRGPGATSLT
jgi:hypothetical protein